MTRRFLDHLAGQTEQLHEDGLYKAERTISSRQDAVITLDDGSEVVNLCANNYLGLANHPALIEAAAGGGCRVRLRHGVGAVHLRHPGPSTGGWKRALSRFLGTEDTILYSSCFDANGGLFETLLGEEDAVISRRPQPRQHHRRRAAVQGAALPLREQRHGRPGAAARRRRPAPGSD